MTRTDAGAATRGPWPSDFPVTDDGVVRVANGTKALDAVQGEKYILGRWSGRSG